MSKKQITKEIYNITQQLIEKYKPEKIILFGSVAHGKFGSDSDLDFFIIKQTKKRFHERVMEALKTLPSHRLPIDFIVYTPKELRQEVALGDFFVEEILEQGQILYDKKTGH